MDNSNTKLIEKFGHCSQELVNLLACGKACSNVFDGIRNIGGLIMNGIATKNDIGYLTLLEHLNYVTVGDNLKIPTYPVWLIGSRDHFTILFSPYFNEEDSHKNPNCLTREEKLIKQATLIFHSFEDAQQESTGFISSSYALQLLQKSQIDQSQLSLLDKEKMGLILWQEYKDLYISYHLKQEMINEPFQCHICTFLNTKGGLSCEMCLTKREIRLIPNDRNSKIFYLYHWNGILESNNLNKILIEKLNENDAMGKSDQRGLRQVIQTRFPNKSILIHFPNALVEYISNEPKI